jgi:hypothetical protein
MDWVRGLVLRGAPALKDGSDGATGLTLGPWGDVVAVEELSGFSACPDLPFGFFCPMIVASPEQRRRSHPTPRPTRPVC